MAQCKKILDNNERCSNQVVPGTNFCQTHTPRIAFRRVDQAVDAAPPPSPKAAPTPTAPLPTGGLKQARPVLSLPFPG